MNFWQQMRKLRDCTGQLAQDLAVPFSRSLIRVHQGVETEIRPNPIIKEVSQTEEQIGSFSSIRGQNRLYTAQGVSKKYERSFLEEQTVDYLIDWGIRCELLEIKDEGLSWTLTLSEKLGQQKMPVNNYPL